MKKFPLDRPSIYSFWNRSIIHSIILILLLPFSVLKTQVLSFENFNIAPNEKNEYGGELDVILFNTDLKLVAPFVLKKEDLRFSGRLDQPITIHSFFKSLGGNSLFNEINVDPFKGLLGQVSIPSFDFSIYPVSKKFVIENDQGVQMKLQKKETDLLYSFTYSPPNEFKFKDIDKSLSIIDDINFVEEFKIGLTNDDEGKKGALKMGLEGLVRKEILVDKIKRVDPKNNLKLHRLFEELPTLLIAGSLDKKFNTHLEAFADFDKKISEEIIFKGIGVSLDYKSPKTLDLGIHGKGILKIDDANLQFTLGLIGEPSSASIGGSFGIVSLDDNNQPQEWYEPFGIPKISFQEIGGALSLSGSSVIDKAAVKMALSLGEKPKSRNSEDRRIKGMIDLDLDVNDPINSSYTADMKNFNLLKIIEAFENDIDIPKSLKDVLNVGINNAKIKLDPSNKSFLIDGDVVFFDFIRGKLKLGLDPSSGAQFAGSVEPILYEIGGVELFAIHSKDDATQGAGYDINIDVKNPKIELNGELKLFGVQGTGTKMFIDKNGINIDAETNFAGLMKGKINIKGSDFLNTGKLKLNGSFKPIFASLADELSEYIRTYGGSLAGEIVDLLFKDIFSVNAITINSSIDNATTALNLGVEYRAIGKDFSFNLPVDIDFASPEKIPATVGNLVAAIGEQIIDNSGDLAIALFNKGVELAEEALDFISDGVKGASKEIEKGLDTIGKGVEKVFKDFVQLFQERKMHSPNSPKGPVKFIEPGYQHFSLTFKGIEVVRADESNGDDVFGQVALKINGDAYMSPGTNPYLFGVSEDSNFDGVKSGLVGRSHTKHIYVKNKTNTELLIHATLYEEDTGGDDLLKGNSLRIQLGNFDPNTNINNMVHHYKYGNSIWRIHYDLKAYPMVTSEMLLSDIRTNNFNNLMKNIGQGGDLKAIQKRAMDEAIKTKNKQVISYLVEKIKTKTTPEQLNMACDSIFDKDLVFLVFKNINNVQNVTARPIDYALKNNTVWLANYMIDKGVKPSNSTLSLSLKKSVPLAKKILGKGINPTYADLDASVSDKNLQAIRLVLTKISPKESTFLISAKANSTSVFKLLYDKNKEAINTIEPAKQAIDNKNFEIFKMCLNKKVTQDMVVVYAVSKNYIPAIEYCLTKGVDTKPVMIKAIEGKKESGPNMKIIKLLSNCKTCNPKLDFNEKEYLQTAVTYSRNGSHKEVVKLLLEKGADPNLYSDPKTGNYLLHLASLKKRKRPSYSNAIGKATKSTIFQMLFLRNKRDHEIMALLLRHGAAVNSKNKSGYTPFHFASNKARKEKDFKMVEAFVKAGANLNACTNKGKSVFQIADGKKVKEYLKQKGAEKKPCN